MRTSRKACQITDTNCYIENLEHDWFVSEIKLFNGNVYSLVKINGSRIARRVLENGFVRDVYICKIYHQIRNVKDINGNIVAKKNNRHTDFLKFTKNAPNRGQPVLIKKYLEDIKLNKKKHDLKSNSSMTVEKIRKERQSKRPSKVEIYKP